MCIARDSLLDLRDILLMKFKKFCIIESGSKAEGTCWTIFLDLSEGSEAETQPICRLSPVSECTFPSMTLTIRKHLG